MVQAFNSKLAFNTPEETADFAQAFADIVRPGDVVLLEGGIGAGKTHFARCLIQDRLSRLGRMEDVPSPTFTLVQTYDIGEIAIWHADLYRLSHPDEIEELGLTEAFETDICLVEWPDRLGDLAPASAITLSFRASDQPGHRTVEITASEGIWGDRIRNILP